MRGVPVISMDVNPDNILVEKGAGLVSKSFEGLCRDVELLVYDKELRINMAHNARSHAINNHSSRNLEAVIQEVFG